MRLFWYLLVVSFFMVSGCSSDGSHLQFVDLVRQYAWDDSLEKGSLRNRVSSDIVSKIGRPIIYVQAPRLNSELLFVEDLRNGDNVSWVSPSNEMISLQNGLLISTRGAGYDLLSADVRDVFLALALDRPRAVRVHRYLDGQNHVLVKSFICEYERSFDTTTAYFRVVPVTRVEETCYGLDREFSNHYWVSSAGEIVRAEQWVSPSIGHIFYERLSSWATL